jgi:hypothetical protein
MGYIQEKLLLPVYFLKVVAGVNILAGWFLKRVKSQNLDFTTTDLLLLIAEGTIVGSFIVRIFLYPSKPYFSNEGLLFFGLHPLSIAFYITTMSLTFLPSISIVTDHIKKGSLRTILKVGLTTLFINSIILVSGSDGTLLLINGVMMTIALLILWTKAITTPSKQIE